MAIAETMTGAKRVLSAEPPSAAPPTMTPGIRALVDAHFAFIARSVRRLGVHELDVDDVTQQVFLIAARKLDRFVDGNEKAFLFGIAVRVASDARRAHRRREAGETAVATAPSTSDPTTPEDVVAARQARARLDEVLDAIPDEMRAVFTLFELEEMTMAEIAVALWNRRERWPRVCDAGARSFTPRQSVCGRGSAAGGTDDEGAAQASR